MDDRELLAQFEALSLPFAQWNHRAHVKVAFLYLRKLGFERAMEELRLRIRAYNAAHRVPESPTSGYNETTTYAFLRLIDATMCAYGAVLPTPDADAFYDTHPQLQHRHALRLFYSPERRMHAAAKTRFVEPDLAPLPRAGRP